VDPEEFRVDSIVDRVNTTAAVWLGSTLACCQCHDHKHDPFSQKDYYRFFAIFNSCETDVAPIPTGSVAAGAMVTVPVRGREGQFREVEQRIATAEQELTTTTEELDAAQEEWEKRVVESAARWRILAPQSARSTGDATLTPKDDGLIVASGAMPAADKYIIDATSDSGRITAVRVELLTDEATSGSKVGRSPHGNVVLSEFTMTAAPAGDPVAKAEPVRLDAAVADHSQMTGGEWPVTAAIDGDAKTGWAVGPEQNRSHAAEFRLATPIQGPVLLTFTLGQQYGAMHTIARLRLSVTDEDWDGIAAAAASPYLESIIRKPRDQRSEDERSFLETYHRSVAPALVHERERLASLKNERATLVAAEAPILRERGTARETRVMVRGNFLNPTDLAEPGVPMVFPQLPADQPASRLTLARWLTDPKNPLTARVAVNRFWEQYFGRGIVETSDDFGIQGDAPTHPELLDYLATEFIRQKWSMKAMHRLIVTSATYRQSSRLTPELKERDPYNRLLARGPRFRVEAEMIRDCALAAGGILSDKIGGPSVFPPQPEGVWTMIYNDDKWVVSTGEDKHRRGLYTFWRRTAPYPTFTAFDAPSREKACTRRPRTDTPLQALATLNDPAFVEAAGALARRMASEGGATVADRIAYGFRVCVARRPEPSERERLVKLYEDELGAYRTDETAARNMVNQAGDLPHGATEAEIAALTVVANVLLNLDETLTKG
jgi:hypothetical protein